MSVEVFSDWKFFPLKTPASNLLGNGSVLVAGTAICKFKILKNKSMETFLAWPSEKYEKDGETKYNNFIFLPDETTRENFQKEGVAAWEVQLSSGAQANKPGSTPAKKSHLPF